VQDTSPEAAARYYELLRAATPERRLHTAMALTKAVRDLALAGIRARFPNADEAELRVRLTVRLYGPDVARKLFHTLPHDAR
jgi:hypothetical protein